VFQVIDEYCRRFTIAIADHPRYQGRRIGIYRGLCPDISSTFNGFLGVGNILLFGISKGSEFIALNFLCRNIEHGFIMKSCTCSSSINK